MRRLAARALRLGRTPAGARWPPTPVTSSLLAIAGMAALPISLHFEGNNGTAEPFLFVLPIAVCVALAGGLIAMRRRMRKLFILNLLTSGAALICWLALLTYAGD